MKLSKRRFGENGNGEVIYRKNNENG